jgi:hypothetical protein
MMLRLKCLPLGAPLPVSLFEASTGMIAMHANTAASAKATLFLTVFPSYDVRQYLSQILSLNKYYC